MPSSPLVVIFNPQSGSSGDKLRARVEAALQKQAVQFEIHETDPDEGAAPAVAAAMKSGATQILVCGGDGTVMSAVNAIGQQETSITLAIVPAGTANLLAQALKIPRGVEEAIAVAVEGNEQMIDLGQCGDRFFALGLGLGLTEKLVSGASSREKEHLGRFAYVLAMLRELGQKPSRFSFRLDDGSPRRAVGVALIVANAGEISGRWKFAPDAKMDDGLLDLCVLHRFYVRDLLRLVWRTLCGHVQQDRVVSFYQAKKIYIASQPPLDLQIDGEVVDTKPPLAIEVRPQMLKVRVPQEKFGHHL